MPEIDGGHWLNLKCCNQTISYCHHCPRFHMLAQLYDFFPNTSTHSVSYLDELSGYSSRSDTGSNAHHKVKTDVVGKMPRGAQWMVFGESDLALLPFTLQREAHAIECPRMLVHRHLESPCPHHHAVCAGSVKPNIILLYNPFDLQSISYRLRTPKRWELFLPTSKNLFNHQTWKMPSPTKTPIWNMLHHLTLAFVLSAVFRWVLSRRTM